MAAPKTISIATPSYNQAQFLERTIDSIWSQSGDFYIEHIIGDGGSDDGSAEVIKAYEERLNSGEYPVKCLGITLTWWSEKDKGQSDAINKCFAKATGDYITWQNSDDTFNPGAFKKVIEYFEKYTKVGCIFGDFYFIDSRDRILQEVHHRPFSKWEFLYEAPGITNQSAFWKRSVMDESGAINGELQFGMDFDFFVRLSEYCKFKYVREFFGNLRMHEVSKTVSTGTSPKWKEEYRKIRARYGVEMDINKPWKEQYKMQKLFFAFRRLFWYLAMGDFGYLWKKLTKHPAVQPWQLPEKTADYKPTLAIVHPAFTLGGATAVAVHAIEALKDNYNITLFTTGEIDVEAANTFFGTSIATSDFTHRTSVKSSFMQNWIKRAFFLEVNWMARYVKRAAQLQRFDYTLATRCEMDLGEPIMQYIHFPVYADEPMRDIGQLPSGMAYSKGPIRALYQQLSLKLSGYNQTAMEQNVTLTNSQWTDSIIKQQYSIDAQVVYPAVRNDFPTVAWEDKLDRFVILGAVSPRKNIEALIDSIEKVQTTYPEIELHIIGNETSANFAQIVHARVNANTNIIWHTKASRAELVDIVAHSKYGIHGMQNEHFGIAVAEMVAAGCLVFVPNSGGQVEIVTDKRLTYSTSDEAVQLITNVLNSDDRGKQLVSAEHIVEQYSSQQFAAKLNQVVDSFIAS